MASNKYSNPNYQPENTRDKKWNTLWSRPKSSILHDPESAIISLRQGSYRVDLRDAFLLQKAGGDPRALDLYYNLLTDPTVFTSMERLITLIYNMEKRLVAGDPSDDESIKCFKYVREQLDLKKNDVRKAVDTAVLSYLVGVTASEILWIPEDGQVSFAIVPVDSRRLAFSLEIDEKANREYYQPRLKTDLDLYPGEALPDRKFIIQTYFTVPIDSPYGLGTGQQLWWLVEFKKNAMELWNKISNRHGMPMVTGKVPDNTSEELVNKFFSSLEDMAEDSTFVIPNDFEVELKNADTGNSEILIKNLIDYCDTKIREVILGESATANTQLEPGLAGAAKDARAITLQKAKRIADDINSTLNNTLIKWLALKNFPNAKPPKLITDTNDNEQISSLLANLQTLFGLGYEVDPDWIEKKVGYPKKPTVQGLGESVETPPRLTPDSENEETPIDSRVVGDLNPTTK